MMAKLFGIIALFQFVLVAEERAIAHQTGLYRGFSGPFVGLAQSLMAG